MQPDLRVGSEILRIIGREQCLVKSHSGKGWHVVEFDDEMRVFRCSCDGYSFRGDCRHRRTVEAFAHGDIHGVPVAA